MELWRSWLFASDSVRNRRVPRGCHQGLSHLLAPPGQLDTLYLGLISLCVPGALGIYTAARIRQAPAQRTPRANRLMSTFQRGPFLWFLRWIQKPRQIWLCCFWHVTWVIWHQRWPLIFLKRVGVEFICFVGPTNNHDPKYIWKSFTWLCWDIICQNYFMRVHTV